MSFVNVYQFVCVCASFPFGFEGGMWDRINSCSLPFSSATFRSSGLLT